ncbi:hypothetical protein D3C80_1060690 [compost metagenome]
MAGLSSTSRIFRLPAATSALSSLATAHGSSSRSIGTMTVNRLPSPGAERAEISPPISSASDRQMDRPSPVPPNSREIVSSAWTKGLNSRSAVSASKPIPVSCTSIRRRSPPPPEVRSTRTSTLPADVNLTAFETRLDTIWVIRTPSPRTRPFAVSENRTDRAMPRSSAVEARISTTAAMSARRSNGAGARRNWPACILDRSSMSSRTRRRESPAPLIRDSICVCRSVSEVWARAEARPSTAFSGVRTSWLILAKKRSRTWAARRASS